MKLKKQIKELIKNNRLTYKILRRPYQLYRFVYLKYFSGSNKDIFQSIYFDNRWGDNSSLSGTGSNLEQTTFIRKEFPIILQKYKIKSILDIPCGDFFWMKELCLDEYKYIGADIVTELIKINNDKFKTKNKKFINLDLTKEKLPKVDLIFCRDCLVHLCNDDIFKVLKNINNSDFKYFMTTNFPNRLSNKDIATGSWRTINLTKAPFNLPEPIESIYENCTENGYEFSDKSLSIWGKDSIQIH